MRYGAGIDTSASVNDVVDQVRSLAAAGFRSASCSQIFGYDAMTLLAVVGSQVPDIELMTAVVPTYPRHPIVMAAQALTVQAATGGRFTLGIGLSHQIVIEGMFGHSFERPARHMRDYLQALMPLLHERKVDYTGPTLKATTIMPLEFDTPAPPVLVAALAPTMLELAGTLADGTVTWMTGPATIGSHIVPGITKAAAAAGRPAPRVVVALPVSVTADTDAARAQADRTFSIYGQLPSYRAMLDREGAEGPGSVAIVGDEDAVARQLAALADAGATDFQAAPYGSPDEMRRTIDLLGELARAAK
ncbi:MAG TPA: TIGR03564 family F420-dependent LLM class oxidoreductase [Acidimicrobiales bacterium]|nr:TIGR03564 family F420-dependent LLM class oxidoreductase [Acidimicrobiales bacterium]